MNVSLDLPLMRFTAEGSNNRGWRETFSVTVVKLFYYC